MTNGIVQERRYSTKFVAPVVMELDHGFVGLAISAVPQFGTWYSRDVSEIPCFTR